MDYQKIIEQLKKGGSVEIESGNSVNNYESCKVRIDKAQIIDTAHATIEHYLVDQAIEKDQHTALIAFDLTVNFPDNTKIKTQQVSFLLKKDGKIRYYGGFEANGDYISESLLHEMTKKCAEYSEEQKNKFVFEPKFLFNVDVYKNMFFEIPAKKIKLKKGGESVILLTDYQRVKDEESKKEYEESKVWTPGELPF